MVKKTAVLEYMRAFPGGLPSDWAQLDKQLNQLLAANELLHDKITRSREQDELRDLLLHHLKELPEFVQTAADRDAEACMQHLIKYCLKLRSESAHSANCQLRRSRKFRPGLFPAVEMAYPDVTIYLRRAGGRPEQVRLLSDYVETQADGTPGGLSYVRFLEDLKKSLNCKSAEKIYIQVLDITTGFGSKAQSITSEGLWVGALLTTVRYNGGPIEFVVSLERPKPVRERAPLPEARQLPAPPTAPQDKRPGTPRPGPVQAVTAEGKGTSSLVPLAPKPPVAAAVPANPSAAAPEKEPAILPLKASSVPSSLHNILILS